MNFVKWYKLISFVQVVCFDGSHGDEQRFDSYENVRQWHNIIGLAHKTNNCFG